MKGIVFTEFLDLVDEGFGEETTERIIDGCPLHSGGVYTSVGTYDPQELKALVGALSSETSVSPEELQRIYGRHLFTRFGVLYGSLLEGYSDLFSFIEAVGPVIHREVLKLYPEAELPEIEASRKSSRRLRVRYTSARDLPHFCRGLLEGAVSHFGATGNVSEPAPLPGTPPSYELLIELETR
jgi:hypothetical protein